MFDRVLNMSLYVITTLTLNWLILALNGLSFIKAAPEVFKKEFFLKTFAIFTGKHPCWNLFLIKLQAFRPATLLKIDCNIGVFL